MKKIAMIIICLFIMSLSAVYAADEMTVMRLHSQSSQYEKFVPGEKDYYSPLKEVSVNIVSSVESNSIVKDGRLNVDKMKQGEQKRVRALLASLINTYIPYHAGPNVNQSSPYELVIVCDTVVDIDIDENSKRFSDIPSIDNTGLKVRPKHFLYPIVHGWYYLVNKNKKIVIFYGEISGTGSVIDTAIDDFALNLTLDFSKKIK